MPSYVNFRPLRELREVGYPPCDRLIFEKAVYKSYRRPLVHLEVKMTTHYSIRFLAKIVKYQTPPTVAFDVK